PAEVLRGEAGERARFRLGGMVEKGSFERPAGSMEASFRVTDGDAQLPVRYTGILPDLFREGQAVVATGRMEGGVFVAENVLAKHDETYMPKEVADKMGVAHQKHEVQVPAPGTEQQWWSGPAPGRPSGGRMLPGVPQEATMLPELGQVLMALALLVSAVQALLPLAGAHRNDPRLMAVARPASYAMLALVGGAFA